MKNNIFLRENYEEKFLSLEDIQEKTSFYLAKLMQYFFEEDQKEE